MKGLSRWGRKRPHTPARLGRASVLALTAAFGLAAFAGLAARAQERAPHPFTPIYRVLQSPRCQNCHPAGDAPHIGDEGRPHRMNVSRKSTDAGLACATCHRSANAPAPHGPPGVPGWQMPPADHPMAFEGRSAHDLCEQLKDPAKNGGKSLADLHGHFAKDPLVLWGYNPGPGRTLPPIAHTDLIQHVDRWIAAGATCPP